MTATRITETRPYLKASDTNYGTLVYDLAS
jgi:hypothetical protein